ncbi:MAG TPA: bifunctional YncE family protein/alkaline phosphatase family protein [Saprospiraceae bacterium]|nr:bifunctional YncE family protein/alkaline phosphatase family protein [Saprospiraceae bacterium]
MYFFSHPLKNILFHLLLWGVYLPVNAQQHPGKQSENVLLPNGWSLSPAGNSLPLGDLPLNMAVSPNKRYLAVTNNGQGRQSLQLIDVRTQKLLHSLEIPVSWLGLAFASDNRTLYVSGGNSNSILRYEIIRNRLQLKDTFSLGKPWPVRISPAGLCLDDKKNLLYVVTKEDHSLYVLDTRTKAILQRDSFGKELYTCVLTPDRKNLLISHWGANELLVWNTQLRRLSSRISVGDNPNDLIVNKKGTLAYVACADNNTVSVVDLQAGKVIESLAATLYPDNLTGSTTNGVALSKNEKTLYIANADNNCLAVFDVSEPQKSRSMGFIPTGWYPTCVRTIGGKVYVANGKGLSSFPNPNGPNPLDTKQKVAYQQGDSTAIAKIEYIGGLMKGTLSIIAEPGAKSLTAYTRQVYQNTPYTHERALVADGEKGNPIPQKVGDPSPVKYVFYIIKENRTYDQMLGDMPEGNGDTALCLFPERITPNHHALARDFVLLDNFYVSAEVSADGHNWSTAGYANDFTEKTWVTSYGDRGGDYVYEGQNKIAWPRDGFIWDHCKRAGITYRTYGEFADDGVPNIPALEGNFCPYYTSWDTSVKDTTRVSQWKRDFDSLVTAGSLPRLNTLRLINDHTEGLRLGRPTPFAQVADNDLALGLFIEHLSQSPVWKESAVFVLEDDAQNGADHVDAHRSIAFVISPYTRRRFADHTMYSTNSMLRTIELILGMPPMSQQNAAATPMWKCFTAQADYSPWKARPCNVNLDDRNAVVNDLQRRSDNFDMSREDRVPDLEFNEVLWKAIKGIYTEMPAPRRSAFLQTETEED